MPMFKSTLIEMRRRVKAGRLTLPVHARDAVYDDDLLAADLEHCILTGEITSRQWDEKWGEWKYIIAGESLDGRVIDVVAKLGHNNDTVVITVFVIY